MLRSGGTLMAVVVLAPCLVAGEAGAPFLEVPHPMEPDNRVLKLEPMPVPEVGKAFQEPGLGSTLRRVTRIDGTNGRHEYSRFDPCNRGQTLIMLTREGDWSIHRTDRLPYNQEATLVRTLTNHEEPRWDPQDPHLLWCLQDHSIITVNVEDGTTRVIKDFRKDPRVGPLIKAQPDLYRITTRQEGEASHDMRYWALGLQGEREDYRLRYVLTWDREKDQVLGLLELKPSQAEIDWLGMSPLGSWVLIGADGGNGAPLDGLVLANRELTTFHQLAHATAHSDVGLDTQGREVIVMQNSRTDTIDLIPLATTVRPVPEDFEDHPHRGTGYVPLIMLTYSSDSPAPFEGGVHISCNHPGYAVVSTYNEPGEQARNWLSRTISLVQLDRDHPRVFTLARVRGVRGAYWEETQATITADGDRILWSTNWSQQVGGEQVFLMEMEMPDRWQERLAGAR